MTADAPLDAVAAAAIRIEQILERTWATSPARTPGQVMADITRATTELRDLAMRDPAAREALRRKTAEGDAKIRGWIAARERERHGSTRLTLLSGPEDQRRPGPSESEGASHRRATDDDTTPT